MLMEKELKYLKGAVDSPVRPMACIVGGAKVSSKVRKLVASAKRARPSASLEHCGPTAAAAACDVLLHLCLSAFVVLSAGRPRKLFGVHRRAPSSERRRVHTNHIGGKAKPPWEI